jgi:hypothetical protein
MTPYWSTHPVSQSESILLEPERKRNVNHFSFFTPDEEPPGGDEWPTEIQRQAASLRAADYGICWLEKGKKIPLGACGH